MVTHISEDGFLSFAQVGGHDVQIIQGMRVRVLTAKGEIPGLLGKKAIHLMRREDMAKVPSTEELWIDIGARDGKEARSLVAIGDCAVTDYGFQPLRNGLAASRAFDDKIGAFAVVVLLRRRDVVGDELKDFSGLAFRSPFAAFAMLLFMLSLGGIPPTAGFMGKFWLFSAAIDANYVWLAVLGVLNSAISLYYYLRVVVTLYMSEPETDELPLPLSPATTVVLVISMLGVLYLGLAPGRLLALVQSLASSLI